MSINTGSGAKRKRSAPPKSIPPIEAASRAVWSVLAVDDEKDIHEVTELTFKRRAWRKRPFEITSCTSAAQAMQLLLGGPRNQFQVALIDVVMESSTAGLELCRFIRAELPMSVRIILRTGQPGVAPEESVINQFDIDYYLAKTEVTPDKLFSAVRSCLRSSQDIDTLLAFSRQLRKFTSALQSITTDEDLLVFMREGLRFLELKHQVRISFVRDMDAPGDAHGNIVEGIKRAHGLGLEHSKMFIGTTVGIDKGYILLFAVQVEGSDQTVRGGFLIDDVQTGLTLNPLQNDLTLFTRNWTIAHGAVLLQQRVAREKMINERMYIERIAGIANMVTGVAHEINTPLGVANTANGMIVSLVEDVHKTPPGPELDAVIADLKESTTLLSKNISRASSLVRSFKQLSSTQLSDERTRADIAAVIQDCIESMSPETRKRNIRFRTSWGPGTRFDWIGYPGHLSQVLVNLIQNAMNYAYANAPGGEVDIRVFESGAKYRLEFEDYGAGVPADIYPHLFEPFVTSGRDRGGTGLGLAITHNIITNLLKGSIECTTAAGKGTKFVLTLPRVVP
jgi:signal transduction histidine kinase/CheY-like chemotaxis protein